MSDRSKYVDPNGRTPWCPGPFSYPCPRCLRTDAECARELATGLASCSEPLRPFAEWALRCLEHGVFAAMWTVSGPPVNGGRIVLEFGVGGIAGVHHGAWWRRGYGNDFETCLAEAMKCLQ